VVTSMMYLSDHGESLGENGVYLHGLPLAFAPPRTNARALADLVVAAVPGVVQDVI
jgi:hypothetical protein